MDHSDIISRFLGDRARRYVKKVAAEWNAYATNPYAKAIPGCLEREAVMHRLIRLAYHRYNKATPARFVQVRL